MSAAASEVLNSRLQCLEAWSMLQQKLLYGKTKRKLWKKNLLIGSPAANVEKQLGTLLKTAKNLK
jgi:hypothetical protein